jgi:hypothetical protein
MKNAFRTALALALIFGLTQSSRAADTSKDLEKTPQVKAYRALLKAMDAGDYEAYKKCMVKAAGPEMDKQTKEMGKTPKETLEFLKMLAPTNMKFTSLKVEGKKATLMAEGKIDTEVNKGTIELAEEDGQWKVGHQSWTNAK